MSASSSAPVDVVVVVVAYRAVDRIDACLDALRAQRLGRTTMQVVVVDNASGDGTADLVASRYPEVRLLRSAANLGFAGGNNLAIRATDSRWVVLLNDDAVAEPDLVARLVAAGDAADDDVAAVAATVLLAERFRRPSSPQDLGPGAVHGPDGVFVPAPDGDVRLVNSTGNEVRTDGFGTDRGWLSDASTHSPPREVFGFSGAATALRRHALEQVGLFDEHFFMYYEDTDLSWRLRRAGWRVEHCADAVAHHRHATSSGEGSAFFEFHDQRNRLLTVLKNGSPGLVLRVVLRHLLTTASIVLRHRQPWSRTRTRLRALASAAAGAPAALRARRRCATVPARAVERLLVPPRADAPGPYRRAGSDATAGHGGSGR